MAQLGRITGALLNANLHRDDIDLKISNTTFDATPVLFFDVGTSTVGIKTDDPNPDFALDVRTDTLTTRLQVDDTAKIIETLKEKFPNIKQPVKEDICYATTNRQLAVKEIALSLIHI